MNPVLGIVLFVVILENVFFAMYVLVSKWK